VIGFRPVDFRSRQAITDTSNMVNWQFGMPRYTLVPDGDAKENDKSLLPPVQWVPIQN
jgi:hypothetical protein